LRAAILLLSLQLSARSFAEPIRPNGKPLIVHAWASWCAPCLMEMPQLLRQLGALHNKIDVVFLSLDDQANDPVAKKRLQQAGRFWGKSLIPGAEAANELLRAVDREWDGSLPSTVLLNKDWQVVAAQHGYTDLSRLLSPLKNRVLFRRHPTH